jgi:hypothetical protein
MGTVGSRVHGRMPALIIKISKFPVSRISKGYTAESWRV